MTNTIKIKVFSNGKYRNLEQFEATDEDAGNIIKAVRFLSKFTDISASIECNPSTQTKQERRLQLMKELAETIRRGSLKSVQQIREHLYRKGISQPEVDNFIDEMKAEPTLGFNHSTQEFNPYAGTV